MRGKTDDRKTDARRLPVERFLPGLAQGIERLVDELAGFAAACGQSVVVGESADLGEGDVGIAEGACDGVEMLGLDFEQVSAGGLGEAGGDIAERLVGG